MSHTPAALFLTALACALTGCVAPGEPYYGGGYAPYYGRYYSPYYGPGYGYGYAGAGWTRVLPVGATCVYEHGEPRWYHHGKCYRRSGSGYVVETKKSSDHHSSRSDDHPSRSKSKSHDTHRTSSRSNHHGAEHKRTATSSQPTLNRENRYGSRGSSHDDGRKSSSHHSHSSSGKDSGKSGGSGGGDRKGR